MLKSKKSKVINGIIIVYLIFLIHSFLSMALNILVFYESPLWKLEGELAAVHINIITMICIYINSQLYKQELLKRSKIILTGELIIILVGLIMPLLTILIFPLNLPINMIILMFYPIFKLRTKSLTHLIDIVVKSIFFTALVVPIIFMPLGMFLFCYTP